MLYRAFAVLAAVLATTSAHNIQMKAHSRECFHEQLHADDKMTVTFQVGDREFGGSGNLDVDFWVRGNMLRKSTYSDSQLRGIGGQGAYLRSTADTKARQSISSPRTRRLVR